MKSVLLAIATVALLSLPAGAQDRPAARTESVNRLRGLLRADDRMMAVEGLGPYRHRARRSACAHRGW